jgi:kynurenine 3-monooxygenase
MDAIAILGAGPVGTVLSLYLARHGHQVCLFEARADPNLVPPAIGRSINLTLAERGWTALREIDAESAIREIVMPLRGRTIHSEDSNTQYQPYSAAGDAIYSASRTALTGRLLALARAESNIDICFDHRCVDVDLNNRTLTFATPQGQVTTTPAQVLAADGTFSIARRTLQRQEAAQFYQRISQMLYREVRVPPTMEGGWAFDAESLHLWPRGDSMIVGFPNIDRSFTVSMFLPLEGEVSFNSLADRSDVEHFAQAFCPDLFAATPGMSTDFFAVPPALLLSSGCYPWVHEDWLALVGDSAHALVPFLGQGLNAGLEDSRVLMGFIEQCDDDWTKAFELYQHSRHRDVEAAVVLAEQHYDELARQAREPTFIRKKALEERLHALLGERFVPMYSMVAFQNRPYSEVEELCGRQEHLLDQLICRLPNDVLIEDLTDEKLLSDIRQLEENARPNSHSVFSEG